METTISNGPVTAVIRHKGAELSSLFHADTKLEYIWQADPAYWAKSSPVLFPIVGQLKENTYTYRETEYTLPRHGFAREMEFALEKSGPDYATFLLTSDSNTRKQYPFDFGLRIHYSISAAGTLEVKYVVTNAGSEPMYFSLGAHPAFRVPLRDDDDYTDYYLQFDRVENADRWKISPQGLIENEHEPLLENTDKLLLRKDLFYEDALVFKDLVSNEISIRSNNHSHGLTFSYHGFPYFGIWAFRDADFVCLEPWCGIADHVGHDQRLERKEGIHVLKPNEPWSRAWSVRSF